MRGHAVAQGTLARWVLGAQNHLHEASCQSGKANVWGLLCWAAWSPWRWRPSAGARSSLEAPGWAGARSTG